MPEPADFDKVRGDFAKVLGDFAEAVASGREPEDVQRERHERELAAASSSSARSRMPKPLRYVFAVSVWLPTYLDDRIRGVNPPASFARGLEWARTGVFASVVRPRRVAVRMTTPAERAPLYAAYAAARQRGEQIGAECDDDSIIQYAVKAYETAEMARLRAQVAAALAFADELDNRGQQPTLLAIRLRERLYQAGPNTGF